MKNNYQQFKKDWEIGEHTHDFEVDSKGMESVGLNLDEVKFVTKLLLKKANDKLKSGNLEVQDMDLFIALESFLGWMSCDWGNFTEEMDKYYMAYYNKFGNN